MWPFTQTEHQKAVIFRLYIIFPLFYSRLAHENRGFEMISSVGKSMAHTFKLTLSSSAKKIKRSQKTTSNLIYKIYSHRIIVEVDYEGNIPDQMRKGTAKWGKNKSTNAAQMMMTWNIFCRLHVRCFFFLFSLFNIRFFWQFEEKNITFLHSLGQLWYLMYLTFGNATSIWTVISELCCNLPLLPVNTTPLLCSFSGLWVAP